MSINLNELLNSTLGKSQLLHDMKTRANNALNSSPTSFNTFDNPSAQIQRITDNTIILATGEHPGLIVDTSTVISGIAGTKLKASIALPGGERTDSLHVNGDNIVVHVSNVHFTGFVRIGIGPSGAIASAPTVIFQNCIFDLTVNCSGKMHLIGCEFRDPVFATAVFSGAANNFVIGCSRKNGTHFGGTTIIAETT